jgi:hypothetical protein
MPTGSTALLGQKNGLNTPVLSLFVSLAQSRMVTASKQGAINFYQDRWYVWRKLCTYLAPTLTLSQNGKKQDSTRPTSPRSSIG